MFFEKAKASDGSEPDPDLRTLTVNKSNYGPAGTVITVKWQNGVYVPVTGAARSTSARRRTARTKSFVRCWPLTRRRPICQRDAKRDLCTESFRARPRSNGIGKPALILAMNRLFAAGRIVTASHGRPSDPRSHIALTAVEVQE